MPPVLLFRETADGEVGDINLSARTPVPGPGSPAEYVGAANRYRVRPDGHIDANGITASIARWPDVLIPPNTTFRIVMDLYREGVDGVAGYFNTHAFCEATAIASWDFLDNLECQIRRNSFTLTDASITWIKDSTEPPPATVRLAFAGSIAHGTNSGVRYEFEVDEQSRVVRIYAGTFDTDRATFGTPADIAPLAMGTLSDELAAHLTADRLVAINSIRAGFNVTNFRLYKFEIWDMGTPVALTGPPCTLLLTVYDDDGVTPLWEVATDPNHARPYLVEPEHYGEREVDIAAGGASLGEVTVTVIDLAQLLGDQDSGYVTGLLADIGVPALEGHRCRFLRFDPSGNPVVIVDGPAGSPRLNPDYASYSWNIRDTGEVERAIRLFDLVRSGAPAISGATPAGPEEAGTDYDFDWDVVVNP